MFDMGYKSARGDSGAGVSSALAGASSGLFVSNLNLKSFRGGKWAIETRGKCEVLFDRVQQYQFNLFSRVTFLHEEVENVLQFELQMEPDSINGDQD